jgi:hypothetical protein
MGTRLKDIVSRENRRVLHAFLGAQAFNIIVTLFIAWLMFGVVKPMLWPTTNKTAQIETTTEPKNEFTLQVIGGDDQTVIDNDDIEHVNIEVVK